MSNKKASLIAVSSKGYYVEWANRYKTQQEALFAEILGDDIDEKIKISKKLKYRQEEAAGQKVVYDEFQETDLIEKVFKEIHKRLSVNSQAVIKQYQKPDYNTLKDKPDGIDLELDPNPLLPSYELGYRKTGYFKGRRDVNRFESQIEQEAEERVKMLIDKFPKAKTNTALLQYAHLLLKELLRNKYLAKKHQEFLEKNEATTVKTTVALDQLKTGESAGLNIALKHDFNRKYKPSKLDLAKVPAKDDESVSDDGEITRDQVENARNIKSRVASLCFDDSKCGTIKIGPARQSVEAIIPFHSTGGSTGGILINSAPDFQQRYLSVARRANLTGGTMRSVPEHYLRGGIKSRSYNSPSLEMHKLLNSKQIRFSQIILAEKKTEVSEELQDSISFIKNQLTGFNPLTTLNTPKMKLTINTVNMPVSSNPNTATTISTVSTPNSTMSSTITPVSTVASSVPNSASSLTVNQPVSPKKKRGVNNKDKFRSKLSNSVSAQELYEGLIECEIEDDKPARTHLEPIIEVASIMEGRKSMTSVSGVEAELMLTTIRSLESRNSREITLKDLVEINKTLSSESKSKKELPVIQEPIEEAEEDKPEAADNRPEAVEEAKQPAEEDDEYADVKSFDSLIDLLTVESIAGTIEHKDFLKVGDEKRASRISRGSRGSRSTTIRKNSALGIVMEHSDSDSESDLSLCSESSSPNTIASDFHDDEDLNYFTDKQYNKSLLKSQLKDHLKRNTMMSCFTEYNVFNDDDIELVFDDKKFNQDFITFNRKRESFDIFETYLLALARMK